MKLQGTLSDQPWLKLTKGPFIDDGVVVSVVEKAGRDPRLCDECCQTFRELSDTQGGATRDIDRKEINDRCKSIPL